VFAPDWLHAILTLLYHMIGRSDRRSATFAKEKRMPGERPNLLFIMTDHQRADSLGMAQAHVEVAPNLTLLASRGTLFTRAYTTCPLCVPARTALATGRYPTRNGVVYNDWNGQRVGDHKPLHQVLAEAGYEVVHVGVHHIRVRPVLEERVPLARWVDNDDYARYLDEKGMDGQPTEGREAFRTGVIERQGDGFVPARYSNTRTTVWPYPAEHFRDSYFCRQGIQYLEGRRTQRPFALFTYLWAPHPPLWVPEPYASLFPPEQIDLSANVAMIADGEASGRRRGIAAQLAEGVSMEEWRKVWAAHLGLVRLADTEIGRLLSALEACGYADNTVVVFTTDHGDHLGQHRMYQKMEMYEQAVRVPLIVRVPGAAPQRCDVPVSHLSVLPTLLDVMDLGRPDDLDGASLAETIMSGAQPEERPVFCQYSGNPTVGDIRRTVISDRYKYTHTPGEVSELYDLERDPPEMRNLGLDPACAPIARELHRLCASWAESHGDWVAF
jgi:arylsulfatase A-like enzyme